MYASSIKDTGVATIELFTPGKTLLCVDNAPGASRGDSPFEESSAEIGYFCFSPVCHLTC